MQNAIYGTIKRKIGLSKKMKRSWKVIGIISVVGIIVMVLGITAGVLWSSIYDLIFTTQLSLTPTSTNFKFWKETPIPMYLKISLFNWTNPADVNSTNDIKPNFVEMGPYVFRQVDYKVNEVWNDNGTVTFQRRRIWHFDETLSNGSLTDEVTNVNPVSATIAYMMRFQTKFTRDIINRIMLILKENLVTTKTVKELLFDGYTDNMLVIAKKLNRSMLPYTKFGWFYGRNGTDDYDGTFNMLTGVNDMHELGILKEWNFANTTKYYHGNCGLITGTNGDLWPPLPENETVSIFISDICTTLKLRKENATIIQGVTGKKYISDDAMLDNGTKVLSRQCYCFNTECIPSGALNISECKYGAPVFISLPHFYLADPSYRDNIVGMKPSKEKHELSIALEPTTGIPLQVRAQLQINLLIQPDEYLTRFKYVKRTFVPMMWFTQEADLTSDYASKVKFILTLPSLGEVTCYGIAGIGGFILLIGVFIYVRQRRQGEEGQVLIPKNETS
ncbi:hypothetical protein KM043_003100 [Ampulex compressa]|nr:hypothetical protein KM043_003100 [Ampulex compressa]